MRDSGKSAHGRARSTARRRVAAAAAAALLGAAPAAAQTREQPTGMIYTCLDDQGRRITSDRPIPACSAREQHILNKDGSLRAVHPPTLTADERAEREARERKDSAERMARVEATRRDKNLLVRYPDEAAHRRAREAALESVRMAIKATEERQMELQAERRPLESEAEFYAGKRMPAKLKSQFDANDAAVEAQKEAATNQQAELARVNRLYDIELERLRRLWAGATPGSMGPLPSPLADKSAAGGR
ncbi:MAG: hypothetical protein ABS84_16990 [Rubrivivax sp. SCN 71-131]|jgi:hypothetical protein|nr:MAG: hypothetical protein ABS84_16990 [Rubrivivax sp. SCN 71-131]